MADAQLDALMSVRGLDSFLLEGKTVQSDVSSIITDVTVDMTIEGASTLTVSMHDGGRRLLSSGVLSDRVTAQLNDLSFELVQVKKTGDGITATFEDLAVAALRRRNEPRKVAPGTMTHVGFAAMLVQEEPWVGFVSRADLAETAKVELARGKPAAQGQPEEREDTWAAIGRIADERGWRRWARGGKVWYLPETFLMQAAPTFTLREFRDGVDFIDFDFDIGKPVATLTAYVRASRWGVPPGDTIAVEDLGPATGKWLASKISRSIFSLQATVTLTKARPTLPEPAPPPPPPPTQDMTKEGAPGGIGPSGGGGLVSTGATSSQGYQWPVRGTITSGYGQRAGGLHAGLDIAVPVGTSVGATRDGTVTFAGSLSGYGNVIFIDHGGVTSRYAHLSRIEAQRGQRVTSGQRIALSGGAAGAPGSGNSTGPHLHFEIRPGDNPADPRRFLP